MADGKWIQGLLPETPLHDAARHVLAVRLQVVADYFPRAVHKAEEDPEHVHQLRVGTRRADAALRLFRACLPGKACRRARKRLRAIRRAAGEARDWDVFLLELADRAATAPKGHLAGLDFLVGFAMGERHAAQAQLASAEDGETLMEVVEAVRPAESHGLEKLGDLASGLIAARTERLASAASGDLEPYENLHQVRIQGKRLRYAMEILADCFPPRFKDDLYPRVEEMQDILGRANDSHVACERLTEIRRQLKRWPATWKRVKPGVEALLRFHQRRL